MTFMTLIYSLAITSFLLSASALYIVAMRQDDKIAKLTKDFKELASSRIAYEVCNECGVVVAKNRAHKVVVTPLIAAVYREWYCGAHKKPYTHRCGSKYFSDEKREVDENGKPIKK